MPGVAGVALLGSTGSIGTQALDVIARATATSTTSSPSPPGATRELLAAQAAEFGVPAERARLRRRPARGPRRARRAPRGRRRAQRGGRLRRAAGDHRRARAGKRLALANKESLIAGGRSCTRCAQAGGGEIVPVDSEHSAVYQCLRGGHGRGGRRGGAHRERRAVPGPDPRPSSAGVTVDDALAHPTWSWGAKITIDSSTLMNKGLEVIEAHELFGVDFDRIDVVVHPQSVVHGMVEFPDGATIAQLSMPDMRLPIGLALGAPPGSTRPSAPIDWAHPRAARLRAPRPRGLPVPGTRLRGGPGRRRRAGDALAAPTRSRSRRSWPAGSPGRPSPRSSTRCSSTGPGTSMTSPTFWKRTGSRATGPRPPIEKRARRVKDPLGDDAPPVETRKAVDGVGSCSSLAVVALVVVAPVDGRDGRDHRRPGPHDHAARVRATTSPPSGRA